MEGWEGLGKRLAELAFDTRHVEHTLQAIGVYAVGSIQKNFEEQGRPKKWSPLSPVTVALRLRGKRHKSGGGMKILQDSTDLKNSISERVVLGGSESYVAVGTNKQYARRQHEGYPGDKSAKLFSGHRPTPARPFLMLQEEDKPKIAKIVERALEK